MLEKTLQGKSWGGVDVRGERRRRSVMISMLAICPLASYKSCMNLICRGVVSMLRELWDMQVLSWSSRVFPQDSERAIWRTCTDDPQYQMLTSTVC